MSQRKGAPAFIGLASRATNPYPPLFTRCSIATSISIVVDWVHDDPEPMTEAFKDQTALWITRRGIDGAWQAFSSWHK